MKRYWRVWLLLTTNSFQTMLASRFGMIVFVLGKLARFGLYLAFIYFLFSGVSRILVYDRYQTLFFLLTFTLMGSIGQMVYREVYRFHEKIISGEFDFDLLRPISPLLRNIAGGFDLMDLLTMPVLVYALVAVMRQLPFDGQRLLLYLLLMSNGLLMMTAIHIGLAGLGIITSEIDHLMMVYRDIETMGRFPVDIYAEPIKTTLLFIIPIGLMFTIPAKAYLGILSWPFILVALVAGVVSMLLSGWFWNFAVRRYSSASS